MSKTLNILLADDHALVLNGLIALLSQDLELHIVATAKDGNTLYDFARYEQYRNWGKTFYQP